MKIGPKPFLLEPHGNKVAIAKPMTQRGGYTKAVDYTSPTQWYAPSINILFAGGEAEDGANGIPACAIHISGYDALMELQEAIAYAILPFVEHRLNTAQGET